MSNQTKVSYTAVFEEIERRVGTSFDPWFFMTDFEQALCNSIRECFPNACILNCYFHYTQVSIDGSFTHFDEPLDLK